MNRTNIFSITGADPSYGNRGLQALAYGAVEAIYTTFPEAKLYFVDYYKSPTPFDYNFNNKNKKIERIGIRYSWKIFLTNNVISLIICSLIIRVLPFKFVKSFIFKFFPTLKRLSEIQIAFSIAGGDSFSDIYGLPILFYVLLPQILFIILGVPLIHLPQTIGPFHNKISNFISRWVLNRSSYIFTRDHSSLLLAQQLAGPGYKNISFSYDVGFLLKPKPVIGFGRKDFQKNDKPVIGINISGLLFHETSKLRFGLSVDYIDLNIELVNFFDKLGTNIILIPHVIDDSYESDLIAIQKFKEILHKEDVIAVHKPLNAQELKYLISQCDFFIGARMHACIGAISQFIPSIPLAYSRKFEGVMKSVQIENSIFDLRTQTIDDFHNHVNNQYSLRNETALQLRTNISKADLLNGSNLRKAMDICFSKRKK